MAQVRFGIITDDHASGYAPLIASLFKEEGVDAVAVLGDMVGRPDVQADEHRRELMRAWRALDRIGVPVFCINGNYEDICGSAASYQQAEAEGLDNILDMNSNPKYQFKRNDVSLDLIFIPGSTTFTRSYIVDSSRPSGQYDEKHGPVQVFNPADLELLVTDPKRTVVFAHNPCYIPGDGSIDLAVNAERNGETIVGPLAHQLIAKGMAQPRYVHAGNKELTEAIRKAGVNKFFSGDIHEAGGRIVTLDGVPLLESVYHSYAFANVGPALHGYFGFATFTDEGKVKVDMNRFEIARDDR